MTGGLLPGNLSGTKDFYGLELKKLKYILNVISGVFEEFGYNELKTPSIESLELIKNAYGQESSKLIYKILNSGINYNDINIDELKDSGDSLLSKKFLLYDLTLPLVRYVYNNRNNIVFPFKRYQIQTVWRADRPQKGRSREFFQCDADIVGSNSLLCELEQIQIISTVFNRLSVKNYNIRINSRKIINDLAALLGVNDKFNEFCIILDKIDKIGVDGVIKEMEIIIKNNSKIEILKKILNSRFDIEFFKSEFKSASISCENILELESFLNFLRDAVKEFNHIIVDFSLVRGLNYYTGIIFEVVSTDINLGSIAGGGRYEYFSNHFGIKELSGVGVSFGINRIYALLDELKIFNISGNDKKRILISNNNNKFDFNIIEQLRKKYIVEYYYSKSDDLKKQLKYANKLLFDYVLINNEIKDLNTGSQISVVDFLNSL